MLADFFTKSLQGNVFRVFWEVIMGYRPLLWLKEMLMSTKELVEDERILVFNNTNEKSNRALKNDNKCMFAEIVKKKCLCKNERLALTKLNQPIE